MQNNIPEGESRSEVSVVVAATLAAQAINSMATLILPAIAPKLAATLGINPSLIGYQVSLVYLAAMASTAVGGSFVKRWGACRITQVSLGLTALGIALAAAPNFVFLFVASLFLGLGYGLANPAASHLLVRYTSPRNRNFIFSLKQTGVPIGGMGAALIAPAIALAFGWQWSLVMVAVLAIFLTSMLQPARSRWDDDREPAASFAQQPLGGIPMIWNRPLLRWLSLMAFCFAAIQLCVATFTVTLLVTEAGYGLIQAGLLLSVVQVAGVVGRLFWGWLADKIHNSIGVLFIVGLIMIGACSLMSFVSPSWPAIALYFLFAVLGASAVGWNGVFLAEVARRSPLDQVGMATGGALFFTFMGVLVGPAAFAFVYSIAKSYTFTFGLLAVMAAAGLFFLVLSRKASAR